MTKIHYEFQDYGKGSTFYESVLSLQERAAAGEDVSRELKFLTDKLDGSPQPDRTRPAGILLMRAATDPGQAVKLIGRALTELAPLNSVGRVETLDKDSAAEE